MPPNQALESPEQAWLNEIDEVNDARVQPWKAYADKITNIEAKESDEPEPFAAASVEFTGYGAVS